MEHSCQGSPFFPAAATGRRERGRLQFVGALSLWCSGTGAALLLPPRRAGARPGIVPLFTECLSTARTAPQPGTAKGCSSRERKPCTFSTSVSSPRCPIFGVARERLAEPGLGRAGMCRDMPSRAGICRDAPGYAGMCRDMPGCAGRSVRGLAAPSRGRR